jgi:7-carboxy-7-deazaguanine synthase
MSYEIAEIFYSLQGEGAQAGRPAIFCRFAGCTLECSFCDTDWKSSGRPGGGAYKSAGELIESAKKLLPRATPPAMPLFLCTGGEPALQVDQELVDALHGEGFEIAIETNGTLPLPGGIDWICVSPKSLESLLIREGTELKLLFPLKDLDPDLFLDMQFKYYYLQPLDGPEKEKNTRLAIDYCLAHPPWRLSVQLHKILGIP